MKTTALRLVVVSSPHHINSDINHMPPRRLPRKTGPQQPIHAALYRLIDVKAGNPHLCDEWVKAVSDKARKGDLTAFKELADRIDGRVPYNHKSETSETATVRVIITGVPRPGRDTPEQPKTIEHQPEPPPNAPTNKD